MRIASVFIFLFIFQFTFYSEAQDAPKLYAHKVTVDSVVQTKAYTYLKVMERVGDKDSLQWLALPSFQPKVDDVYYYDGGLKMGEFNSRELNRTFEDIMFMSFLSTSAEVSDKTIVPAAAVDTVPLNQAPAVIHTVVVKEVIQAGGYTYLRVSEGNKEEWLAAVRIGASVGQTFTYDDAAPMTNFTSKELKRTFDNILFVAKLTPVNKNNTNEAPDKTTGKGKKHSGGIITIAELYKNRQAYAGKVVRVKGEVTKYSQNILDKNWIHIEDGSAFSGKKDLSATIQQEVKVGDKITVEGRLTLDKDFGSGYRFELLVEDAAIQAN